MAVNTVHEVDGLLNDATHGREPERAIEATLRSLLDLYGPSMLFESDRLATDLQDQYPDAEREIAMLLKALDEQVPQELLSAHTDEDLQRLLPRLAQRLSDRTALTPEASTWAVRTWARGLGFSADAAGALPELLDADLGSSWDVNEGQAKRPGYFDAFRSGRRQQGWRPGSVLAWIATGAVFVVAVVIWFVFVKNPLEITQVATSTPLIGDGKKREVFVTFSADKVDVRNVEVRFVRGDGEWDRRPFSIAVSPDATARGRTAAGQIALRTFNPATATFAYVLVAADGKRSAPFEKTFEFAPGPAKPRAIIAAKPAIVAVQPGVAAVAPAITSVKPVIPVVEPAITPSKPVITAIGVPRRIVAGKPFSLTIAYEDGAGRVERIERKVIESTVRWQPEAMAVATSALPRPTPGSVNLPFTAPRLPSRSTLEFTLVDRDGVRSEPRRVAVDVVPPPARRASIECTSATCGRVVSVSEIGQKAEGSGPGAAMAGVPGRLPGQRIGRGETTYEVTVRTDNGTLHILTQTTRWKKGARVRVIANTITPLHS